MPEEIKINFGGQIYLMKRMHTGDVGCDYSVCEQQRRAEVFPQRKDRYKLHPNRALPTGSKR